MYTSQCLLVGGAVLTISTPTKATRDALVAIACGGMWYVAYVALAG